MGLTTEKNESVLSILNWEVKLTADNKTDCYNTNHSSAKAPKTMSNIALDRFSCLHQDTEEEYLLCKILIVFKSIFIALLNLFPWWPCT